MINNGFRRQSLLIAFRFYSRIRPPPPAPAVPVLRVTNNIAHLGPPKEGPKPRQLLSLPPFPGYPLPGKASSSGHFTAISWVKYYFQAASNSVVQSLFNNGLVQTECRYMDSSNETKAMRKVMHDEVMNKGAIIHIPVSVAASSISKRFDTIPSGTLYPNADEISYLQRLVHYKDSAILVLNKPPKLPVKGNLPVHNSMDALAAAALTFGYNEGPKLVHRLDRESSGIILFGRTKESVNHLQWLFNRNDSAKLSDKDWNDACEGTYQRYWALVIGRPKEDEGIINAPISKVLLNDGKTERVILAHCSSLEASQKAITEYRVLGPTINGCSWIELCPRTSRKHQLRVHCAEALGTPIVGDYKYGWFVHSKWKQMPRVDIETKTGKPYKLKRPVGLAVQKGSVLSKVPLLHLHCRELVLPNIAKFIGRAKKEEEVSFQKLGDDSFQNLELVSQPDLRAKKEQEVSFQNLELMSQPDLLRFVVSMPSHMKISWNLMSTYLV